MDRILTLEQVAAEGDATRRRTAALFVAGIVIGALVLGAFVWMAGPGLAPNSPPGEATVAMKNIAFNPGVLNVARGTTVTWVNQDPVYHTVTSDAPGGPLDSPSINQGERWTFTFTQDGTYAYHCTPHSSYDAGTQMWTGMTGKVVVGTGQGGNGTGPLDLPHATYDARTTRPAAGEKWIVLEAKELPLEVTPGQALAPSTCPPRPRAPLERDVRRDHRGPRGRHPPGPGRRVRARPERDLPHGRIRRERGVPRRHHEDGDGRSHVRRVQRVREPVQRRAPHRR